MKSVKTYDVKSTKNIRVGDTVLDREGKEHQIVDVKKAGYLFNLTFDDSYPHQTYTGNYNFKVAEDEGYAGF